MNQDEKYLLLNKPNAATLFGEKNQLSLIRAGYTAHSLRAQGH